MSRHPPRTLLNLLLLAVITPLHAEQSAAQTAFATRLSAAALERTEHRVRYDGGYRAIAYPMGDVPDDIGVCADLVIRAYRRLGIDLQREVHEAMRADFATFPNLWGLKGPDPNIDHRRVPNLERLFELYGERLPVTSDPSDYRTGDLVTWRLGGRLPHIGIVLDKRSDDGNRPLVAHNVGSGPQVEDVLFEYPIHRHYRYYGAQSRPTNP